jgi:WD40 repeat protein
VNTSEPGSGEPTFPVLAPDGKRLNAVAVHPDWKKEIYAVSSYQANVQVNGYRLELDGPAQALAFDESTLLAACTETSLYLFDWRCGALLAYTRLPSESSTTLGMAITWLNASNKAVVTAPAAANGQDLIKAMPCVARVNGFGDIQVWSVEQGLLRWDPSLSVIGEQATCVTPSGMYGTSASTIGNWVNPRDAPTFNTPEDRPHPGGILDLFQDDKGYLSCGNDGTVKKWSPSMQQQIPMRKSDPSLKTYSSPVCSVFRVGENGDVVLRLADGSIYCRGEKVLPHLINQGLVPADGVAAAHMSTNPALDVGYEAAYTNNAGRKVFVTDFHMTVSQQPDCTFQFDDKVRLSTISADRTLVAVVSSCNDLYILDASTCLLIYFWPFSVIGCNVGTIRFREAHERASRGDAAMRKSKRGSGWGAAQAPAAPLFEDLFINNRQFDYKS